MYLKLAVLSMAVALSACSSGSNNGGGTTGGGTTGGGTTGGGTTGGTTGGGTTGGGTDSKAGVWQGNLGYGNGVYIVDNNNNMYGLASSDGSSYHSLFGNLGSGDTYTGTLDTHFHPASNAVKGIAFAPQGEDIDSANYNLNIVNGQTIESLDTNNPFTLTYTTNGLQPAATVASVNGTWEGVHSFCASATSCSEFTIELTFNGGSFTGETGVAALPNGENTFPVDMSGTISEFGSVLTTQYSWGERTLNGVIYFDANGNLVLNGDNASEQTISSILSR